MAGYIYTYDTSCILPIVFRDAGGIYLTNTKHFLDQDNDLIFIKAGCYCHNTTTGDVFVCKTSFVLPNRRGATSTYVSGGVSYSIVPRTITKEYVNYLSYVRTDIIEKPASGLVKNTTIKRSKSNQLTVSWKVSSEATSSSSNSRATRAKVCVNYLLGGTWKYDVDVQSVDISTTSITHTISTSRYYPIISNNSGDAISRVSAFVYLGNNYGYQTTPNTGVLYLGYPGAPTISALTHNAQTGVVSATIKTNDTSGDAYIYDTYYYFSVTQHTNNPYKDVTTKTNSTNKGSSFSASVTLEGRTSFTSAYDYIKVTLGAWSRSLGGSGSTSIVTKYVAYPNKPTIAAKSVSLNLTRSIFSIQTFTTSSDNIHVSTGIRIQKLLSVTYKSASEIPANASWQDIGTDSGITTAFSIETAQIKPEAGKTTWIRVKSWNDIESLYYVYSDPIRLRALETEPPPVPSAADDIVDIISCTSGSDAKSAVVRVGWSRTDRNADDSNNTEVSWSDTEYAWHSTTPPDTYTMQDSDWNEGQVTANSKTYQKSATIQIAGLESGKTYYIMARRVMVPQSGTTTYGPYSAKVRVTPIETVSVTSSITLVSDTMVVRGEPMQLSWTYDSGGEQTSWTLYKTTSGGDSVLALGDDSRMSYSLPFYRDEKNGSYPIVSNSEGAISLYVEVTVGGFLIRSNTVKAVIQSKPLLSLAVAPTMTVQPLSLSAFTDSPNSTVSVVISSSGITYASPSESRTQSQTDTIWSGTVAPEWSLTSEFDYDQDLQDAKDALDAAQEDYDAASDAYEAAKSLVMSLRADVSRLTSEVAANTRDLSDAATELSAALSALSGLEENDPDYETAYNDVQRTQEACDELSTTLSGNESLLAQSQSDLQDAEDAFDAMDISTEEEALTQALSDYAQAEAAALADTEDGALTHVATITMPSGLELIDNGQYKVAAFLTNDSNGLDSNVVETTFSVALAHQAPRPSSYITVTPIDETNDDGVRTIGSRIELAEPTRAYSSDVYDIYRVSSNGIVLALSDVPTDAVVIDRFATFGDGDMYYRVACRTVDGSVDWLDFRSYLDVESSVSKTLMRVDWNGKYVELTRNAMPSDGYDKQFVSHTHLDGSVSGHWNRRTAHTMSIGASLVRKYESDQERLITELASYAGSCLVRTSDGMWVEGNVNVRSISRSNTSANVSLSIEVSEISVTGAFDAGIEEIEE